MIRIGIVGCGRILAAHLRGYRLLREAGIDNFRITALCSRRQDDARMYLRRGSDQRPAVSGIAGDPLAVHDQYLSDFQDDVVAKTYSDYREMIEAGPIDAVNDFTSHGMHHLVAATASRCGKHLLTQKPLAVTVAAGRRMCDQFRSAGRVLAVFENWRFRDKTRFVKWLLDSGRLGNPQLLLFNNVGSWWAPNQIVAGTPWRHQRAAGGGIALDMGVHQFHLIRHLVGNVLSVSATTAVLEPTRFVFNQAGDPVQTVRCDADDFFSATFRAENKAIGVLTASWAGHGGPTIIGPGIVVYGSKGRVADLTLTSDDGATENISDLYTHQCPGSRVAREFPHGLQDEFALAQLDWLTAVESQQEPQTSGEQGLADLAAAFAIHESAVAGRSVSVEEVLLGGLSTYQEQIDRHFGIKESQP